LPSNDKRILAESKVFCYFGLCIDVLAKYFFVEHKHTIVSERTPFKNAYTSILWSAVFLLFGRAYNLFFWPSNYQLSANASIFLSVLLLFGIPAAFRAYRGNLWIKIVLNTMGLILMILSLLPLDQFLFHLTVLLQVSPPVFLALFQLKNVEKTPFILALKLIVSLTFMSHGLLCIGVQEVPDQFIWTIHSILGVEGQEAYKVLKIIGLIDLLMSVAIFVNRFTLGIALYMTFWGFSTAMATMIMHTQEAPIWETIHLWGSDFLIHLPNAGMPMSIFYLEKWRNKYLST
jgi:hypothetical protein